MGGTIWRKFRFSEENWIWFTILCKISALGEHGGEDISNEISGGDLDEMIDLKNLKLRDLCYFSRNFLELVMHGETILNGDDLDETGSYKVEN